ncbi:MAG: creatininase family protein [Candidatus Edwardsbacteria bacterium]|nr:creatininase family protein [Candidatus Edwardsbacteria bacterium]
MERHLSRINWKQFQRLVPTKTDRVLLPVGTVEAHGPGALGTDAIIPAHLAERLAEPLNALIAPAVNYGITRSLIGFPGSLTVSPETFERYLSEIGVSLGRAGFTRIVIINGHGGNIEPLKGVSQRLWDEGRIRSVAVHWWLTAEEIGRKHFGGIGHAMADELGALLAIDPALVSLKDYRKDEAGFCPAGIAPFPHHRAMIIKEKGKGYPDFNRAKSIRYLDEAVALILSSLQDIFNGWDAIRRCPISP